MLTDKSDLLNAVTLEELRILQKRIGLSASSGFEEELKKVNYYSNDDSFCVLIRIINFASFCLLHPL